MFQKQKHMEIGLFVLRLFHHRNMISVISQPGDKEYQILEINGETRYSYPNL